MAYGNVSFDRNVVVFYSVLNYSIHVNIYRWTHNAKYPVNPIGFNLLINLYKFNDGKTELRKTPRFIINIIISI